MNKRIVQLTIAAAFSLLVLGSLSFDSATRLDHFSTEGQDLCFVVPDEDKAKTASTPVAEHTPYLGKTFAGFKEAVGFKESGGNYGIVNSFGYMGKYQFGPGTLRLIGIYNPDKFIKDPELQEAAFEAYAARNKWVLRREIERYVGKEINGVLITESGILAAAHLAGPGNVKKYLRSGGSRGFKDAFGTSVRYYLQRFSGYDTSGVRPDRKARVL